MTAKTMATIINNGMEWQLGAWPSNRQQAAASRQLVMSAGHSAIGRMRNVIHLEASRGECDCKWQLKRELRVLLTF